MELPGALPVVGVETVLRLHGGVVDVLEGVLDLPVFGQDDLGEEGLVAQSFAGWVEAEAEVVGVGGQGQVGARSDAGDVSTKNNDPPLSGSRRCVAPVTVQGGMLAL
ncbi:MAG: hypothetical protein LBO20_01990 [Bifidobacteriaceae bacterium]|nr:hypothetical protein [Bifidobacteriaceae bacterium]